MARRIIYPVYIVWQHPGEEMKEDEQKFSSIVEAQMYVNQVNQSPHALAQMGQAYYVSTD